MKVYQIPFQVGNDLADISIRDNKTGLKLYDGCAFSALFLGELSERDIVDWDETQRGAKPYYVFYVAEKPKKSEWLPE